MIALLAAVAEAGGWGGAATKAPSVLTHPGHPIAANPLAGAQDLLHDPRRRHCHDNPQRPLVGSQEQAGDGALERPGGVELTSIKGRSEPRTVRTSLSG